MDCPRSRALTGLRFVLRATIVVAVFQSTLHREALADELRLVPQLGLTDLDPKQVAFAPNNNDLLAVLNSSGRIDLFDVANPEKPVKTAEFPAGASSMAFSPDGERIVSGGSNGTVRLWSRHSLTPPCVCVRSEFTGQLSCWLSVVTNHGSDPFI